MVKYYGRARTRTGSVNTTQHGLKMSGCPSKVGLSAQNNRYIQHRVSCMRGICGYPLVNGSIWRYSLKNMPPFCAEPSHKCLASAGGIGNINTPYYKTVQAGKKGCGLRNTILPFGLRLTTVLVEQEEGLRIVGFLKSGLGAAGDFEDGAGTLQPKQHKGVTVTAVYTAEVGDITVLYLYLSGNFVNTSSVPFNNLTIRSASGEVIGSFSWDRAAKFFASGTVPADTTVGVWCYPSGTTPDTDISTGGCSPSSGFEVGTYTLQFN